MVSQNYVLLRIILKLPFTVWAIRKQQQMSLLKPFLKRALQMHGVSFQVCLSKHQIIFIKVLNCSVIKYVFMIVMISDHHTSHCLQTHCYPVTSSYQCNSFFSRQFSNYFHLSAFSNSFINCL